VNVVRFRSLRVLRIGLHWLHGGALLLFAFSLVHLRSHIACVSSHLWFGFISHRYLFGSSPHRGFFGLVGSCGSLSLRTSRSLALSAARSSPRTAYRTITAFGSPVFLPPPLAGPPPSSSSPFWFTAIACNCIAPHTYLHPACLPTPCLPVLCPHLPTTPRYPGLHAIPLSCSLLPVTSTGSVYNGRRRRNWRISGVATVSQLSSGTGGEPGDLSSVTGGRTPGASAAAHRSVCGFIWFTGSPHLPLPATHHIPHHLHLFAAPFPTFLHPPTTTFPVTFSLHCTSLFLHLLQ